MPNVVAIDTITYICKKNAMPQSLSKIYIHLIFHIKTTSPVLRDEDLPRLYGYMAETLKICGCVNVLIGGVGDHIHTLFLLSRDESIAHVVEELKRNSSRWIKSIGAYYGKFSWQGGYAAFSVSQSVVEKTIDYISRQKEHHTRLTFAEEYRKFLESYGVDYNSDYVFKD